SEKVKTVLGVDVYVCVARLDKSHIPRTLPNIKNGLGREVKKRKSWACCSDILQSVLPPHNFPQKKALRPCAERASGSCDRPPNFYIRLLHGSNNYSTIVVEAFVVVLSVVYSFL
ncbi:hypothetical protein C7G64_19020, partial [Acinetobacter baumannii]